MMTDIVIFDRTKVKSRKTENFLEKVRNFWEETEKFDGEDSAWSLKKKRLEKKKEEIGEEKGRKSDGGNSDPYIFCVLV